MTGKVGNQDPRSVRRETSIKIMGCVRYSEMERYGGRLTISGTF